MLKQYQMMEMNEMSRIALNDINDCDATPGESSERIEARLTMLAKNFKSIRASMTSTSNSALVAASTTTLRQFGTARLTTGRAISGRPIQQHNQIDAPEPMIAIALSDMEYLMRSARSTKSSARSERQSGCTCSCHIAAGVTVLPRSARFTIEGGLSTHTLMNHTDSRIAVKITCSDNHMYRVTPVYATVEPGQSLPLHIARIKSDLIKRDRLCVNIIEAEGSKEAKELFKKNTTKSASINMALNVTTTGEDNKRIHPN